MAEPATGSDAVPQATGSAASSASAASGEPSDRLPRGVIFALELVEQLLARGGIGLRGEPEHEQQEPAPQPRQTTAQGRATNAGTASVSRAARSSRTSP